jgi:hypothetical protein
MDCADGIMVFFVIFFCINSSAESFYVVNFKGMTKGERAKIYVFVVKSLFFLMPLGIQFLKLSAFGILPFSMLPSLAGNTVCRVYLLHFVLAGFAQGKKEGMICSKNKFDKIAKTSV